MFYLLLVPSILCIDISQKAEVTAALDKMTANLIGYYTAPGASEQGTIKPSTSSTSSGFQWYEGGIFWGIISEYTRTTGNVSYIAMEREALAAASFNQTGNFLGSNEALAITLLGKWNDDILWYALATSSLASITKKDLPNPGGLSNYQISLNTYNQVQSQYDDVCGGGIYWSRNRKDATRGAYKSSITNCQQILLGAQLQAMDGSQNGKFVSDSAATYNWLKSSGAVDSQFNVYDGIKTDQNCAVSNSLFSYPAGILSGGLAYLYKATNDVQYLNDAHAIFRTGSKNFATNGIVTDPCETSMTCSADQVSPKGVAIRGWGYLYELTNSQDIRSEIRQLLSKSVDAMLKTCDSNMNCGNFWNAGTVGSDVHQQMNAVELMTAYLKTFTDGPAGNFDFSSVGSTDGNSSSNSSGANTGSSLSTGAIVGIVVAALFLFICLLLIKSCFDKKRKSKRFSSLSKNPRIVQV